jgi:hypothetical protein
VAEVQAGKIWIRWTGRKHRYHKILVERLWRTVKNKEVYLRTYSDSVEAEIILVRLLWT